MSNKVTESFDAHEGGSYEWDYDEEPRKPRVLWGRVIALIAVVLLAFLFGRATAGGDGPSQAELDRLQDEVSDLRAENEELQEAAAALVEPSPEPTLTEAATTPGEGEDRFYTVKEGDTLRGIAIRFYGDPALDDLIAEANDISDPTQLSVGARLTIPPEPEG